MEGRLGDSDHQRWPPGPLGFGSVHLQDTRAAPWVPHPGGEPHPASWRKGLSGPSCGGTDSTFTLCLAQRVASHPSLVLSVTASLLFSVCL